MTNGDVLNLKNRKEIYNLIFKYPGLHLRNIIKKIDLSEGTIRYHLGYLEKRQLITTKQDNGYRRFYVNNHIGNKDKEIMAILREKIPRYVLLILLFDKAASRARISKDLEVTPQVIEYHLKKLVDAGLIKKVKVENGLVYVNHRAVKFQEYKNVTNEIVYILSDYALVNDFFIINKNWFFDKITSDLIKYSIELEKNKPPKKLQTYKKALDKTIDNLYEVFPPPYYI